MASQIGDAELLAIVHNNLGEVFLCQGDLSRAKAEFRWTIDARNRLGNIGLNALAEANLATCLMHELRFQEARRHLDDGLRDSRPEGVRV
jgi:hypothetical protein